MPDAETALAMLSLEAATALVFAAGFLLGCLLTCCCLRCRKHAEPESQVTFKVDMPKSYPYENLTATDWGWTKHLFFHFVFVFIIIFFSCPFVSFFHVNVCFRLHHHFLHAHRCFFMRDCVYRLRPLKLRLPSHLLLNPLCYPLLPWSASHFLLFCISCCEMYLNCRSRVAETI